VSADLQLFCPCPKGLEHALADELRALGATIGDATASGVGFRGDRTVAYAANLHSRLASRVLLRVAEGRYRDDDDLYRLANRCPWETWFGPQATLRVDVSAQRSPLRSLNFATLRLKDGLVDRFRSRTGERPSIDTRQPQARVFAFLDERTAVLYLDLSGEPLFKRGWRSEREDKGAAPLKENLAAGLLALAGWRPEVALHDPFCGSGTIVIEAAQMACGIAPGLSRRFAFEQHLDFDAGLWARLRADAVRRVQAGAGAPGTGARIAASDIDADAVAQTVRNAQRAGIPPGLVATRVADMCAAPAPFAQAGMIVTNPPYGERLDLQPSRGGSGRGAARGAEAASPDADWAAVGAALKDRYAGWSAWILSSDSDLPRRLGMKPKRRTPLYNGAIECRLFSFEIFPARG
jgi:putative N6-adenine-specific DNA methylase